MLDFSYRSKVRVQPHVLGPLISLLRGDLDPFQSALKKDFDFDSGQKCFYMGHISNYFLLYVHISYNSENYAQFSIMSLSEV